MVKDDFKLVFQRTLFAKIFLNIILILCNLTLYFYISHSTFLVTAIMSGVMGMFILGVNYRINDNVLSKQFFMFKNFEINIDEIQTVEFYSVRKAGYFRINIASPDEDEYRLLFQNGEIIKIPSYYMNGRTTVGEYLCKHYKINKKVTKKTKYIYG